MDNGLLNYNIYDDRTPNEKAFGFKMWEQYDEAHGNEIYADEMGFQIESQNGNIHCFSEKASLRVTHVYKYAKDEFQRFVQEEAIAHRRGLVKTCWLFDRNNNGNTSTNDTVIFITFKQAIDNLWFIINYDNMLFPPNDPTHKPNLARVLSKTWQVVRTCKYLQELAR